MVCLGLGEFGSIVGLILYYLYLSTYISLNNQILSSPLLIFAITCLGFSLSTVQPTDKQVPKTDFTVPVRFLAKDFSSTALAIFFT